MTIDDLSATGRRMFRPEAVCPACWGQSVEPVRARLNHTNDLATCPHAAVTVIFSSTQKRLLPGQLPISIRLDLPLNATKYRTQSVCLWRVGTTCAVPAGWRRSIECYLVERIRLVAGLRPASQRPGRHMPGARCGTVPREAAQSRTPHKHGQAV